MRKAFFQTEKQQYVAPNISVIKLENQGHLLENSLYDPNKQGGSDGDVEEG